MYTYMYIYIYMCITYMYIICIYIYIHTCSCTLRTSARRSRCPLFGAHVCSENSPSIAINNNDSY